MEKLEQFFEAVKKEFMMTLATSENGCVTMRTVSPVLYDGKVLIFTELSSLKAKQLQANPKCCMSVGGFFAQAEAQFLGSTMLDCNAALREAYDAKFKGAFDEGMVQGGRNSDFILFKPTRLTGWAFASDTPAEGEIPSIPFDIVLD